MNERGGNGEDVSQYRKNFPGMSDEDIRGELAQARLALKLVQGQDVSGGHMTDELGEDMGGPYFPYQQWKNMADGYIAKLKKFGMQYEIDEIDKITRRKIMSGHLVSVKF